MKTKLILLASFAIGTAAVAQETAPMTPPAPATEAAPAATDAAPAPTTTDTSASVDTTAPAAAAPTAEATDTSNYPACSRSVTDKCVQTHERHRARPR